MASLVVPLFRSRLWLALALLAPLAAHTKTAPSQFQIVESVPEASSKYPPAKPGALIC